MKIYLGLAVCLAWICLARTNQFCIEDVKVVTADGVFEQIKKQELENGRVVRSETIHIKKPNKEKVKVDETPSKDFLASRQIAEEEQQEKRKRILGMMLRHLRMAKLFHSLLSEFPAESAALEKPKVHSGHHVHRILVIRFPLASAPISSVTLPSRNRTQYILSSPEKSGKQCPLFPEKENVLTDRPEFLTTPSIQDQIPSPDISGNQITDNEIPTD